MIQCSDFSIQLEDLEQMGPNSHLEATSGEGQQLS